MTDERFAGLVDCIDKRVTEFLVLEMCAHLVHQTSPECFAAMPVDCFVSNHSELVRAWGHPNQDVASLSVFVHTQSVEPSLGRDQRVALNLSALNKNTDFAGRF